MMNKIDIPDRGKKKRVVIVGGGFGGLKLARKLKNDQFQVVLLDKNNYHLFQPLLYQVATAGIEPSAISFPFRKIFKKRKYFHIRICEARRVIPEQKLLETSIGAIDYDYLVINGDDAVEAAADEIIGIADSEKRRTSRNKTFYDDFFA